MGDGDDDVVDLALVLSIGRRRRSAPAIDTRAPIPVTRARLVGACVIPTRELTLDAKVTRAVRGEPRGCSCTPRPIAR